MNTHSNTVWCLDLDGNIFCSVSEDKDLILYEFNEEVEKIKVMKIMGGIHKRPVYSVSILNGIIVTGGGDNSISVFCYYMNDGKIKVELVENIIGAHGEDINCVILLHDYELISLKKCLGGRLFASCADDGEVKIWQLISEMSEL